MGYKHAGPYVGFTLIVLHNFSNKYNHIVFLFRNIFILECLGKGRWGLIIPQEITRIFFSLTLLGGIFTTKTPSLITALGTSPVGTYLLTFGEKIVKPPPSFFIVGDKFLIKISRLWIHTLHMLESSAYSVSPYNMRKWYMVPAELKVWIQSSRLQ